MSLATNSSIFFLAVLRAVRAALPATSVSALSVSTCTLNFSAVVLLDVLDGREGGVNSVQLLHVELLSPVPVDGHLDKLVRGLDLENGDTGEGDQRVLGVMLRLDCLLYLVLLVSLLFKLVGGLDLDTGVLDDGDQRVLSVLLRLVVLLNLVLLISLHVNFVLDKVYSGDDYWRILGILPCLVNLQ